MAGMYYSLQDVMKKLGKSEAVIREMVKGGKLHEYRDGAKVVFKMDEIDTIAAQHAEMDISGSEIELVLDETGEISLDSGAGTPPQKGADMSAGFGLSGMGDLTNADTNVGSAGINVLGETDDEYKLTEDTKAETQALGGFDEDELGDLGDLGDLDADSNLESVGSGSGLLDLSLQADDTSLGAVLDDILPAAVDGAPEGMDLQDDVAEEADKIFEESQSSVDGVAPVAAEPLPQAPVVSAQAYQATVATDDGAGAYGAAMFLPLITVIYAAIVVFAGSRNVVPGILKGVAAKEFYGIGLIWYIVIVLSVLTLLVVAVSGMSGGKKAKKK
ncbi:MAG: helix-turn-helix domain-containing protein [Phycisphaerae bacterium]|nr:helix-turn-helix domain-containing protein [Phycisphaerae bacterium]